MQPRPKAKPPCGPPILPLIAYGIIFHRSIAGKALIVLGVIIALAALIGWGSEPLEEAH